MPAGLSVAIALLAVAGADDPAARETAAAAQSHGPVLAAPAKPPPRGAAPRPAQPCKTAPPSADATEIVVCAERPQGYRINPDLMEARRQARHLPQRRSNGHMKDNECASVGPRGCIAGPTINLLAAIPVAVTMASKAIRGENVGSMFVTRPEPSEYDLYVEAKRQREADEAEAAAAAVAKATATVAAMPAQTAPKP